MASQKKKAINKLGFLAFSAFQKSFLRKDAAGAEEAGAKLGLLLYRLDKKHRERALSNLALALPELSAEERMVIARKCFQHFGRIFGDFIRSPRRTNEEVLGATTLLGLENLEQGLA